MRLRIFVLERTYSLKISISYIQKVLSNSLRRKLRIFSYILENK